MQSLEKTIQANVCSQMGLAKGITLPTVLHRELVPLVSLSVLTIHVKKGATDLKIALVWMTAKELYQMVRQFSL